MEAAGSQQSFTLQDPPVARLLFEDVRLAWLWLLLRVWLGVQWLTAGSGKLTDPAWMESGLAVQRFWERAVAIPESGRPLAAFDWYRAFLQALLEGGHATWFAKLVAVSETLIGVALILGALTGIAAFVGLFMNWHFIMAGTASVNALLLVAGILLVLAWKTAGWIGLDRFLLPALGTPWQPGSLTQRRPARPEAGRAGAGS